MYVVNESGPVIIEHQPRDTVKLPIIQIGRSRKRVRKPKRSRHTKSTPLMLSGIRLKK